MCDLAQLGSRALGYHRPFSDLDVLFEFDDGARHDLLISEIMERLENSNLPIKVDLVNRADVAQSYRLQIEKDKIELPSA